ncbi:MAG: hypothetical protein BWY75_00899 [bacterium ADurb.Bin425]|nr:MAG: hypothetical protein BWY75_00899 [bacterium ADurb.Bin425]
MNDLLFMGYRQSLGYCSEAGKGIILRQRSASLDYLRERLPFKQFHDIERRRISVDTHVVDLHD